MAQVLPPQTRPGAQYQSHQQQLQHSPRHHQSRPSGPHPHSMSHSHLYPHPQPPSHPSSSSADAISPCYSSLSSHSRLSRTRQISGMPCDSSESGRLNKRISSTSSFRSLTDLAAVATNAGPSSSFSSKLGRSRSAVSLGSLSASECNSSQRQPTRHTTRSGTPPASPQPLGLRAVCPNSRSGVTIERPSIPPTPPTTSKSLPLSQSKPKPSSTPLSITVPVTAPCTRAPEHGSSAPGSGSSSPKHSSGSVKLPRIRRKKHPGLIRSSSLSTVPKSSALVPLTSLSEIRAEEEAAKENPKDFGGSQFPGMLRLNDSSASLNSWGSGSPRSATFPEVRAPPGVVLPSLKSILSLDEDEELYEEPDEIGGFSIDSGSDEDSPIRKKRTYKSRIKQLRHLRRRKNNGEWMDENDSDHYDSDDENAPHEPYQAEDDCAILRPDPERQVDYLTHEWCEEEVSSSWKTIVAKRWYYGDVSRLENASWRSWAKYKYGLKTASPESLNWYKDEDSGHLYGPFLPKRESKPSENGENVPQSPTSATARPILKKRVNSEAMLFDSRSLTVLLRESTTPGSEVDLSDLASVSAARRMLPKRPSLAEKRRYSDRPEGVSTEELSPLKRVTTSTPDCQPGTRVKGRTGTKPSRERHIRFDTTVMQCMAVPIEADVDDEPLPVFPPTSRSMLARGSDISGDDDGSDDDSDSDGGMEIQFRPRLAELNAYRSASRSSLGSIVTDAAPPSCAANSPAPIIVMLPPTVLRPDSGSGRQTSNEGRLYDSNREPLIYEPEVDRTAAGGVDEADDDDSDSDDDGGLVMGSRPIPAPAKSAPVRPSRSSQTSVSDGVAPVRVGSGQRSVSGSASSLGPDVASFLAASDSTSDLVMPMLNGTMVHQPNPTPTQVLLGTVVGTLHTLRDMVHEVIKVGRP